MTPQSLTTYTLTYKPTAPLAEWNYFTTVYCNHIPKYKLPSIFQNVGGVGSVKMIEAKTGSGWTQMRQL